MYVVLLSVECPVPRRCVGIWAVLVDRPWPLRQLPQHAGPGHYMPAGSRCFLSPYMGLEKRVMGLFGRPEPGDLECGWRALALIPSMLPCCPHGGTLAGQTRLTRWYILRSSQSEQPSVPCFHPPLEHSEPT